MATYNRKETELLRKHFVEGFASAEGSNNGLWYYLKKDRKRRFRRIDALKFLKK